MKRDSRFEESPWLAGCFNQRPNVEKGLCAARSLIPGWSITPHTSKWGMSTYDEPSRSIQWNTCEGYCSLMHEVSHALLGHTSSWGVDCLTSETEAWEKSEELCKQFGLYFHYGVAEGFLRTYYVGFNRTFVPPAWKWRPRRG